MPSRRFVFDGAHFSVLMLFYDVLSLGVYEAGQRIEIYCIWEILSGRPVGIVMIIMSRKWEFNFVGNFFSCSEEFISGTKKI